MNGSVIPALEDFLKQSPTPEPQYLGPPDPNMVPMRDASMPGAVVGRGFTTQPTILNIVNEQGQGFPVDLSQISPDKMANAAVPAHAHATASEAAVTTFHKLASGQNHSAPADTGIRPNTIVRDLARVRAKPMGRPEETPAAVVATAVNSNPVVGFLEQGRRQAVPSPMTPPSPQNQQTPPGVKITYEVPNYGPLEVAYHHVIANNGFLLLAYDKRYPGFNGFPRQATQLGMHIQGTDKLYLVQPSGAEFAFGPWALCVMAVVSEGSYASYEAAKNGNPLAMQMDQFPLPEEANNDGEVRGYPPGVYASGYNGNPPSGLSGTDHDLIPGI